MSYICETCNKLFGRKGNLDAHVESVHLEIKKSHCETCNKSFCRKDYLQWHIKTVHNNEKTFQCDSCDKSYGGNNNLQRHIRIIHFKKKPFKCEICDQLFGEKQHLQKHVDTVHDKLKPFGCDACNQSFGSNGHLQRHFKICTGRENISSGEYQVRETLRNMKVGFTHNVTQYELKKFCGKSLRFDFLIEKEGFNNTVIEFNGKHHYEPVRFGGMLQEDADRFFKKQLKHDRLKRAFCEENNYNLLEIHYKDYDRINEIVSDYLIQHLDWGVEV